MTELWTPDHRCPVCNGARRSLHHHRGSDGSRILFPTEIDPEYEAWKKTARPFEQKWTKEFFVCAACLGAGTRSAFTARVLSGEFNPQSVTQTTPD